MIVLGIDPSLASTGWAIVDRTKRLYLAGGTIRTDPQQSRVSRLVHLAREFETAMVGGQIQVVVIEKPAISGVYGRGKGDSTGMLAKDRGMSELHVARGVLLLVAARWVGGAPLVIEVGASRYSSAERTQRVTLLIPDLAKHRTSEHERDAAYYAAFGAIPPTAFRAP